MGKRKSRTVQKGAVKLKVATVFDCPYCSRRDTVEVKLQRKEGIGYLSCRVCAVRFQMRMSPLTKEVDVYCEWIDSAEQLNAGKQKGFGLVEGASDSEDDVRALKAAYPESKSSDEEVVKV